LVLYSWQSIKKQIVDSPEAAVKATIISAYRQEKRISIRKNSGKNSLTNTGEVRKIILKRINPRITVTP
jgi:hypothetical protein